MWRLKCSFHRTLNCQEFGLSILRQSRTHLCGTFCRSSYVFDSFSFFPMHLWDKQNFDFQHPPISNTCDSSKHNAHSFVRYRCSFQPTKSTFELRGQHCTNEDSSLKSQTSNHHQISTLCSNFGLKTSKNSSVGSSFPFAL